jgi:diacylglycerol kinase family enzyme
LDLELAVSIILTGGIIRIDVGEVNGHVFVNNSSLGIYPWVVRERENQQKRGYSKWHAFGRAALLVFKHYSPLRVRVRIDGDDQAETATPFIFIGNNRYEATGLNIGERKALTEGQLWVCRAPRVSRTRLLGLAFQCVVGVGSVADLEMFEAQQISVRSDRARLSVAVDGEVVLLETPLEYRIRRRALNVIVPAEVDDASE